jgi:hypothetical protein
MTELLFNAKSAKKVVLIIDYLPVFLWYFFGISLVLTKEIPKKYQRNTKEHTENKRIIYCLNFEYFTVNRYINPFFCMGGASYAARYVLKYIKHNSIYCINDETQHSMASHDPGGPACLHSIAP